MEELRILLIRHAESHWNAAGRWQGHQGPGLTDRGRAQAEATAAYLTRVERDVTLIVRSDLERVVETAAPTERRLPVEVVVDQRWRELDVGSWAGMTHEEVAVADPDGYQGWRAGHDLPRGGAETFSALRDRVRSAVQALSDGRGAGTVVVFTHGGPIRAALAETLELPPSGDAWFAGARNCSVTALVRRRSRLLVASYNATGHLAAGN